MAALSGRFQPGPYALFLSPNRYVQTFFPRPGLLKTPGENIKHLLTGGLHSVRILPEDVAILVSLAGDSVNILFGIDATTAFTNRDEQGGYHFRVFEQIQCAVRDARAFQCLIFG